MKEMVGEEVIHTCKVEKREVGKVSEEVEMGEVGTRTPRVERRVKEEREGERKGKGKVKVVVLKVETKEVDMALQMVELEGVVTVVEGTVKVEGGKAKVELLKTETKVGRALQLGGL